MPSKLALRLRDVAYQPRRIARPARTNAVRHLAAGNPSSLGHRLAYAVARSATYVEGFMHALHRLLLEPAKRADMRVGEITEVDVVARTGAIGRRIIVTQQDERWTEAKHGIDRKRQQMGFR